MDPDLRVIRVACQRCRYRALRKLKAGDERTLDELNRSIRCGSCRARASQGLVKAEFVKAPSWMRPKRRRPPPPRRPACPSAKAEHPRWDAHQAGEHPSPDPPRADHVPQGSFLQGVFWTVIASVPAAMAICLAAVVLFVAGTGGLLVAKALARAVDYEMADNFRNSPKGGYYDRNGGGYLRGNGN